MSTQVTRSWICDQCGLTVTLKGTGGEGYPALWSHVNGKDYCNLHEITVIYRRGRIAEVGVWEPSALSTNPTQR